MHVQPGDEILSKLHALSEVDTGVSKSRIGLLSVPVDSLQTISSNAEVNPLPAKTLKKKVNADLSLFNI